MKKLQILVFSFFSSVAFLLSIAFSPIPNFRAIAQQQTSLIVSAAISLTESLQEIKQLYQPSKSNVAITYNFGASGALQQQIEQGAPADVFISAAPKQMDALEKKGLLLEGTRRNLLKNSVVAIVPLNSTTGISNFKDLTRTQIKRIAIGEPRSVPAGQYAEEVLKSFGIYEGLKSKLVFANNVRQVLTFVESGNVDAGIVYITDAKQSKRVKVVATAAENIHSPIIYPVAVIKSSKNAASASDFVKVLNGDRAKAVFAKYGFTTF